MFYLQLTHCKSVFYGERMTEFTPRSPYMDYRNSVPFMDLSGFVVKQPNFADELPAKSLQEHLMKKRLSTMINLRRLQYRNRTEDYRNGRREIY